MTEPWAVPGERSWTFGLRTIVLVSPPFTSHSRLSEAIDGRLGSWTDSQKGVDLDTTETVYVSVLTNEMFFDSADSVSPNSASNSTLSFKNSTPASVGHEIQVKSLVLQNSSSPQESAVCTKLST